MPLIAATNQCSSGSRLMRASAMVEAKPASFSTGSEPCAVIIGSLRERGLVVALAKRTGGLIGVFCCSCVSPSMSLLTVLTRATSLKLLIYTVE